MTLIPPPQAIDSDSFANLLPTLKLIATDLDGTLTRQQQFTPLLLERLEQLEAAGLAVLIVTGRSAGWVSALVYYLPVRGAIAENGGIFFHKTQTQPIALTPIADWASHRQSLYHIFAQLQARLPQIQESADNRFRLTDWTFDVQGLSLAELDWLQQTCKASGWGFTYSTVQCHIRPKLQDKAPALKAVLQTHFAPVLPEAVLTVGDSPNDESLFERAQFPHSVGVANLADYCDRLHHQPAYITRLAEADGFSELVEKILAGRR
ncbi:MAG: HAD family phosphatase [Leptolyngbyaceae cyanobacterium SM1_1_3]|nr:HAD family phosphatase [Leptolyngbyaceae cyanobacterium SM1_1_3]NJN04911.1 HAD family phosphatase [Leptolyngbyaceae cyanobacterium RM1_1_2]NJO11583.1 HAD family phosphatase [Leptolyngbyaceae cyanobacterium SL_1_1]